MTRKSFLTLVSALFLVFMFIACGSDKKESEKTDTGDTEAVTDTDPADTGDTEVVPDEDPTDSGDADVLPDEDNTDTGNVTQDGCTIKSSFGTRSIKRDIAETCIEEIAKAKDAECSWNYKNGEETAKHIAYLQKLKITFGNECKDKNGEESVECPDFIPETLELESLSGCDVYSIDPDTDCIAPCTDLYFPTDDDIFRTVYVGGTFGQSFIKSSDSIKEASLYSEMNIGSNKAVFTWSEKAEDGTEIEKKVSVEMKVVDPVTGEGEEVPAQCEYDGQKYEAGYKIATDFCQTSTCTNGNFYFVDSLECEHCYYGDFDDPDNTTDSQAEIGDKQHFTCPDGSKIDWCECVADDTDDILGRKWQCADRVDLNCPTE